MSEKTDDIIKGKLNRVCEYAKNIQLRTFGKKHPGGKDRMAMAVIFEMKFRHFMSDINGSEGEINDAQSIEVIKKLDFLIDIYNANHLTWKEFWAGEQPIDPRTMQLVGTDGKKHIFDLNEVKEITIGSLITRPSF